MNKVTLIARLGKDPETSYTPGGKPVTKMRIAHKRSKETTHTDWFTVIAWGEEWATHCQELKKGQVVTVEGYLTNREWKGKDGTTKSAVEIVATRLAKYERVQASYDHAKAAANDLDDAPSW